MNEAQAPSTGRDAGTLSHHVQRKLRMAIKTTRQRLAPRSVEQHVFVAGMQRSGTNMLMDVLDASHATQVFHETDPRAFHGYEMRDRVVIHRLARACPAPILVVKALCELDLITSLMTEFAPAKTLWVVRDWRDSVNSAVKSFSNFVPQWNRLAHEESSDDWRGRGMSDATRTLLRRLFRDDATECDGAAIMWYYRNILFFDQAFERDSRVRLVFYEDLVQNPMQEMRAVFDFLNIDHLSSAMVGKVHAGSVGRRAPPVVVPEVRQLCDGLFKRFTSLRGRGGP